MAKPQNFRRQISESGDNLYINKWQSGLVTQRSPLQTPVSSLGLQLISRHDTLADGLNTELSTTLTLVRRPGFPNYCSSAFGSSDWPLAYYSFKKLDGTLFPIVDAPTAAYSFDTGSMRVFYPKNLTNQTSFQKVGSMLYLCEGFNANKWDGTYNWASFSQGNFSNTDYWQKTAGAVVDNTITDPLGGATGSKFTAAGSTSTLFQDMHGLHPRNQAVYPITFSVYLKIPSGGPVNVTLKIMSGSGLTQIATLTASVTTSWQRFQLTGTPSLTDGGTRIQITPPNSQELHVWGAQAELASAASTYIATTGFVQPLSFWGIANGNAAPGVSSGAGSLSPTIGYSWVYCFKNSETGHYSTASAASASTGPLTTKQFTLTGVTNRDPQVDKISIFRTLDGGSLYYFVADVQMPQSTSPDVFDRPASWTYIDNNADSVLNTDIVAPLAHSNDQVTSSANLAKFHLDRMWIAAGNKVYFAGGPDTTTGVPEEAFPPANVFVFPEKVTAMASTPNGLIVFTTSDSYVILGSSTASFWSQPWQRNFGVASQNCVAQDGDLLFIYTSKQQLVMLGTDLTEIGFSIGDKLRANFPAATSYITSHRNGQDCGLFISNGTDSIYRYSLSFNAWSPLAQPVGGVGAIGSIETTAANWTLMAGRTSGSGNLLGRSTTSTQDGAGSSYSAYSTIGSLVLAPPGQLAAVGEVLTEVLPVGTYPTISVLLNEISGSFTALPNPVSDPAEFSGTSFASSTITSKRHYFKAAATPLPQRVRHLQIKVDFGTENFKNELLGLAIE